jgi:ribosomal protein L6P/L9E
MIVKKNFITYFFKKTTFKLYKKKDFNVYFMRVDKTSTLMIEHKNVLQLSKYIMLPISCLVEVTSNSIVNKSLNSISTNFYCNLILDSISTFQNFYKQLSLKGTGFKIIRNSKGNYLECKIGFTNKKLFQLPSNQTCVIVITKGILTFISQDKGFLGNISVALKNFRKPNAYTGKGIVYFKLPLKLKPTKKQ